VFSNTCYYVDEIKDGEMVGAHNTCKVDKKCITQTVLFRKPEEI